MSNGSRWAENSILNPSRLNAESSTFPMAVRAISRGAERPPKSPSHKARGGGTTIKTSTEHPNAEQMSFYLSGLFEDKEGLKDHLRSCEECRRQIASLHSFNARLQLDRWLRHMVAMPDDPEPHLMIDCVFCSEVLDELTKEWATVAEIDRHE